LEDSPDLVEPRFQLLNLIQATPNLDWLLLTEQPENWHKCLSDVKSMPRYSNYEHIAEHWLSGYILPNVWVGVSIEDRASANERIPHLLRIPAMVRFLSCEPLLGPIDISPYLWLEGPTAIGPWTDAIGRPRGGGRGFGGQAWSRIVADDLHWVIVGGESGSEARPMHLDWVRSLRDQCQDANVPFFFKQWGEWIPRRLSSPDEFDDSMHVWDCWPGIDGNWEIGGANVSVRVGKKTAGRILDDREWNEIPDCC
jgi:protein gp37